MTCSRCTAADPAEAWQLALGLVVVADLVAESHFTASVRECPACAQRYLWIFGETVDWADGEDPQEHVVIPITADELESCLDTEVERCLGGLDPRRHLCRSFGRFDDAPRAYWSDGPVVVPAHD